MKQKVIWASLIVFSLLLLTTLTAVADTTYTVKAGDTLSTIAAQFDVTVAAIVEANDITDPNVITVGQVLTIPTAGEAVPPPPPAEDPVSAPETAVSGYTIQPGDSLYKIAERFGVTVTALIEANDIDTPGIIIVGHTLTIPGTAVAAAPPAADAPAAPPAPQPNANLLRNPSFEEDWYHINGIPELQIPQHWTFEWDQGPTGFGGAPWDVWVRPEVRVLPSAFLPPHEHPLFIYHGDRTLKVFKGSGAISFRVFQDVALEPGTYQFSISLYPDQVASYIDGQKFHPSDPNAGEVRFIIGSGGSGWIAPAYLQKNTLTHTFTVNATQTMRIGVGARGKFAIENNGWFMDDWSLVKLP